MSAPRPLLPDICYLCLSRDRKIFRLSVSFSQIFGFLTNWYPQTDARVCWECRAALERLRSFKAQAERAVWMLESKRTGSEPDNFQSLSMLNTSNIVVIDLLVYNNANSNVIKELSVDNRVSKQGNSNVAKELSVDTRVSKKGKSKVTKELSVDSRESKKGKSKVTKELSVDNRVSKQGKSNVAKELSVDTRVSKKGNSNVIKELSVDTHVSKEGDKTIALVLKPIVEEENDQRKVNTEIVYVDTADNITDFFKAEVDADLHTDLRDDDSYDDDDPHDNVDSSKCNQTVVLSSDEDTDGIYDVAGPSTSLKNAWTTKRNMSEARRAEERKYELYQKGKAFRCDHCGKEFAERSHITTHMKIHSKIIKCELCDYHCSSDTQLKEHTLTHLDPSHWPYECDECHMRFLHRHQLVVHTSTYTGEHPYKCATCDRAFANKQDWTWHINNKHTVKREFAPPAAPSATIIAEAERPIDEVRPKVEEAQYECDYCGKVFDQRRKLAVHVKLHNKKITCELCAHKCASISRLKKHMLAHLDPSHRPFECELCHKRFIDKYKLLLHTRAHNGERPFKCNTCERTFISKEELTAHVKKMHNVGEAGVKKFEQPRTKSFYRNKKLYDESTNPEPTPKQCDICKKKLRSYIAFNRHSCEIFACAACGNKFQGRSMLKLHVEEVHGGKPYECNICEFKFENKFRLRGHMTAHSDEKNFMCSECPATFKYQSGLWGHSLIHKGEKQHQCSICEARFTLKSNLVGHMKSHTNERPFQCDVCGKKFPWKRNLKNHLKIHQ